MRELLCPREPNVLEPNEQTTLNPSLDILSTVHSEASCQGDPNHLQDESLEGNLSLGSPFASCWPQMQILGEGIFDGYSHGINQGQLGMSRLKVEKQAQGQPTWKRVKIIPFWLRLC